MSRATAEQLRELIGANAHHSKYLSLQPGLPLGVESLDRLLPDQGLPRGQVTEIAVPPAAGLATSLGLWACRAAQREAQARGSEAWCAFVDPSHTLFAPGVRAAGVELERLLVVRPAIESVDRIAVKLAEAHFFSVVVIDAALGPWHGQAQNIASTRWSRAVRRLSMTISGTTSQVLLLTNLNTPRTLPLPVALRLELQRTASDRLLVHVAKDKRGRIGSPRSIAIAPDEPSLTARRAHTSEDDSPVIERPVIERPVIERPVHSNVPRASARDSAAPLRLEPSCIGGGSSAPMRALRAVPEAAPR